MEKYLRHYAEPDIAALQGLPDQAPWSNVVVIPACNETAGFLRAPPPCGGRSLMILVINEALSAPAHVSASNQALAATVRVQFELKWQSCTDYAGVGLSLLEDPVAPRDILLVDRFNQDRQLPLKGGVGHARKVGADLAAALIDRQSVLSSWIHCTDADVALPETYFAASHAVQNRDSKCAVLIYPFQHGAGHDTAVSPEVMAATQLYELSLRYYVAGMKRAGSPYAFHTIGSTMAVSAAHYAKVRGFPKRAAGEDFYLLNKLAKVGSVQELAPGPDCEPIAIASRHSDRVPFGTGAAVGKIMDLPDLLKDFRFYHPAVFEMLLLWLQSLPGIWQSGSSELSISMFAAPCTGADERAGRELLVAELRELKTQQALEHAFRQSQDSDQFMRQMHTWFDAFRTLKLIHALRERYLPSISYAELEATREFRQLLTEDLDLLAFYELTRR